MPLRALRILGWLALLAGVILQLWLKDRHPCLAVFFYAMPKPCLAGLAGVLMLLPGQRVWRRVLAGVIMLAITLWWLMASWSSGQESAPAAASNSLTKDEITVLYWNLCRPKAVDQEALELVRELHPQIAAFVEPGQDLTKHLSAYEKALPDYKAAWMPRGVLWLSRLSSRYRERGKLDGLGAYARFEVYEPAPFQVVVADVHPSLMHSREQQLKEVLAQSQERDDTIFVGDFNTPLESVYFDVWRTRYTHAFSAAGSGFRETWPVGLPLLSIDHIWVGKAWEVLEARKIWRLTGSDHAALFVRLRRK